MHAFTIIHILLKPQIHTRKINKPLQKSLSASVAHIKVVDGGLVEGVDGARARHKAWEHNA